MATVQKSIDVNVPVRTAYNQWTQFESFPEYMENVKEVHQISEKRLHWKAQVAGKTEEWEANITEQVPDQRIAWSRASGAKNAGVVTFERLGDDRARVNLKLDYEPEGMVEKAGSAMGVVEREVEEDLKNFKKFIESRGTETGAWRGEVRGGKVEKGGSG